MGGGGYCGALRGSMAGSFCWALTIADTASQWTEIRVTWNNGAEAVVGQSYAWARATAFGNTNYDAT